MSASLRARRPLTPQEGAIARAHLASIYEACDRGTTVELEVLAGTLGRQMATPMLEPAVGSTPARVRPLVYETGCAAALTAACHRLGVDPDAYLVLMDQARIAEAAIPADPAP